ncbi:MAG: hypothetical protein ACRD0Y_09900 [Terriglobales bacterium]
MNLTLGVLLPYWTRLLCMLLATGAVAYVAGAVLASAAAPLVVRRMQTWQDGAPERAGGIALTLRLSPLIAAALASVVLCLPSYMWLEPRRGHAEYMSPICLGLALAGVAGLGWMALRAARAAVAGQRFRRRAQASGQSCEIQGRRVRVLTGAVPSMAVSGVWHPVLTVSQTAHLQLSPEQLSVGIAHEGAHVTARDNLKRLLILTTPLAGAAARALEETWARLAEWAADDRAVAGDAPRSLALAETLVTLARLSTQSACTPVLALASALERGWGSELSERVARLLAFERAPRPPRRQQPWLGYAIVGVVLWAMLQPTTLLTAHAVLERLVR